MTNKKFSKGKEEYLNLRDILQKYLTKESNLEYELGKRADFREEMTKIRGLKRPREKAEQEIKAYEKDIKDYFLVGMNIDKYYHGGKK